MNSASLVTSSRFRAVNRLDIALEAMIFVSLEAGKRTATSTRTRPNSVNNVRVITALTLSCISHDSLPCCHTCFSWLRASVWIPPDGYCVQSINVLLPAVAELQLLQLVCVSSATPARSP